MIAVAILTTNDFDAALVDPTTATLGDDFGSDTPVSKRRNDTLFALMEDVDHDDPMRPGHPALRAAYCPSAHGATAL